MGKFKQKNDYDEKRSRILIGILIGILFIVVFISFGYLVDIVMGGK